MKALAATLCARRVELGISRTELSEMLGFSARLLHQFEQGQRKLPLAVFPVYALALDLEIREVCHAALQQFDPGFYACLLGAPLQLEIEGLPPRDLHGRALMEVREEDAFWIQQLDEADSTTRRCVRELTEQLLKIPELPVA